MFLNYIKDFFTLKLITKNLNNVKLSSIDARIHTVGILFDESYFTEKEALVQDLNSQGILPQDIQVLVFKNTIKKNETFSYPTFSHKDLSWKASFESSEVKAFIAQRFDLLINYYDMPKAPLLAVSNQSKAGFKVGFASIDKKLNHFIINTTAEKHEEFMTELVKYLKILNKL
ncbi:MAG: hypothetical protein KA325_07750 [Flavobacterium sp.]|nr:hypothetical protein [Flavobacterium sp.]